MIDALPPQMDRESMVDQLADYQAWRSVNKDFSLFDYAVCTATPDLLVAFAELFAPDLVLYEGRYFLQRQFTEEGYRGWKDKLGDPVAVQKMINHVHMRNFFQKQDVAEEMYLIAAQILAAMWSAAFRDKGLVAVATGSDGDHAAVTLYQAETQRP